MDAQFKKGVLELCVLSRLVKDDKYGYELTEDISQENVRHCRYIIFNFKKTKR